jgi:hypothetical protein
MGAGKRGGATLETRRGGPAYRDRPIEDRATGTTTNTTNKITPGGVNRAQAYISIMSRRMAPPHPVAYLAIRPELPPRPVRPGLVYAIRCQLPGVKLARYGTLFASPQNYQVRLPQVLGLLADLVVTPGLHGYIGPGAAREIRQAVTARLPIVILVRRGLVALPDCRIEALPEDDRRPWRELRIVLSRPAPLNPALRASLWAMGARRPGRRP